MRKTLFLNGPWTFTQSGGTLTGPATVPGCIHTDLLENGMIVDPFYRDNEDKQTWIGHSEWIYERNFTVDGEWASHLNPVLVCEGLDTLATVILNGEVIGEADNMFHAWRFDLAGKLLPGQNKLRIRFRNTFKEADAMAGDQRLWCSGGGGFRAWGGHYIRKNQSNYGWDWGPVCVTAGIWKDIYLLAEPDVSIRDVHVRQVSVRPGNADVSLSVEGRVSGKTGAHLHATLLLAGKVISKEECVFTEHNSMGMHIKNPALWWSNGLGPQTLHDVVIECRSPEGEVLDKWEHKIGLREIRLIREKDEGGESFCFEINGHRIFAKGSNWIPADVFPSRITRGHLRQLLESARDCHHNMIRVWGGGIYEHPDFYDLCDELGLLVWQDFMYACAAYPFHIPAWRKNIEHEAEQVVKRLRNHCSLALWCGNNELEYMKRTFLTGEESERMTEEDYVEMFHRVFPSVVAEHSPDTPYWPSSTHNPDPEDWWQSNDAGDTHLWLVWWGLKPFEDYRENPTRFCSEFGFQSFPHIKTIESCTEPEDRNVSSYVMDRHQKGNTLLGSGNATMLAYASNLFSLPDSFEKQVVISQLTQALAIKTGVEFWRQNQPRCAGALYWQLNDCWPGQSWSSIDYFGRWKALHYESRRFYAPLLISANEDKTNGSAEIYLTNESADDAEISWTANVTTASGETLAHFEGTAVLESGESRCEETLELQALRETHCARNLFVWLEAGHEGKPVSQNLLSFSPPKHWLLENPQLDVTSKRDKKALLCTITATTAAAFWVHVDPELDLHGDDLYFHLPVGSSKTILLTPNQSGDLPDSKTIRTSIRSLFNYCQHRSDD